MTIIRGVFVILRIIAIIFALQFSVFHTAFGAAVPESPTFTLEIKNTGISSPDLKIAQVTTPTDASKNKRKIKKKLKKKKRKVRKKVKKTKKRKKRIKNKNKRKKLKSKKKRKKFKSKKKRKKKKTKRKSRKTKKKLKKVKKSIKEKTPTN